MPTKRRVRKRTAGSDSDGSASSLSGEEKPDDASPGPSGGGGKSPGQGRAQEPEPDAAGSSDGSAAEDEREYMMLRHSDDDSPPGDVAEAPAAGEKRHVIPRSPLRTASMRGRRLPSVGSRVGSRGVGKGGKGKGGGGGSPPVPFRVGGDAPPAVRGVFVYPSGGPAPSASASSVANETPRPAVQFAEDYAPSGLTPGGPSAPTPGTHAGAPGIFPGSSPRGLGAYPGVFPPGSSPRSSPGYIASAPSWGDIDVMRLGTFDYGDAPHAEAAAGGLPEEAYAWQTLSHPSMSHGSYGYPMPPPGYYPAPRVAPSASFGGSLDAAALPGEKSVVTPAQGERKAPQWERTGNQWPQRSPIAATELADERKGGSSSGSDGGGEELDGVSFSTLAQRFF